MNGGWQIGLKSAQAGGENAGPGPGCGLGTAVCCNGPSGCACHGLDRREKAALAQCARAWAAKRDGPTGRDCKEDEIFFYFIFQKHFSDMYLMNI
jgi:hypothetical protein